MAAKHFNEDPEPAVWQEPKGTIKGASIDPLHPCAPEASRRDPQFYDLVALVDAVRAGRTSERKLARAELESRLL